MKTEITPHALAVRFCVSLKRIVSGEQLLITRTSMMKSRTSVGLPFLASSGDIKETLKFFAGFPNDVRWERVLLKRDELKEIKYIAWDYWLDITDGSRLALDAAKRIVSGMMDEGEAKGFWAVADAVRQGITLPELILVSARKKDDLVVLEGHVRLTGYLLRPENLPPELPAIVGYSEGIRLWELY